MPQAPRELCIGQRSIGRGVNLYSLQKERALGQSMASAIDHGTTLVADPDINGYINELGQKIARYSDAEVPFTIKVIDSLGLRVFALPGGFLYVDKGLIMEVDSEAELAGLMAHEIAHVAARHACAVADSALFAPHDGKPSPSQRINEVAREIWPRQWPVD